MNLIEFKRHKNGLKSIVVLTTERFLCFFVQIGNDDTSSQNGIIGMVCGHRGCCFSGQCVQLLSGDSSVKTIDHLQRNRNLLTVNAERVEIIVYGYVTDASRTHRVDIIHIQSIAELLDTRRDFIEMNLLFASTCKISVGQKVSFDRFPLRKRDNKLRRIMKCSNSPRLKTNIFSARTIFVLVFT